MNFNFDDNQINIIVNALAQRPFGEVVNLMNEIQRQVVAAQPQTGPQLVPVTPPPEGQVGT